MAATGWIAKLVAAFVEGDENLLTGLIEKKLEGMGEDALLGLLGGPLAMAGEIGQVLQSGGASEFNRVRDQWLHNITPGKLPYQGMIQKVLDTLSAKYGPMPQGKWTRTSWAQSREDWLTNHWLHDWQSQPRDWHGRWMVGRLSQPYQLTRPKRVRGIKARRLRRVRRKMARKLARQMLGDRGR